jgi:hypothetical protein
LLVNLSGYSHRSSRVRNNEHPPFHAPRGRNQTMLHGLRPHRAKTFLRIGPEREETCCQGWDVVIDRDPYGKL